MTTCFALAALGSPYDFEFYVNLLKSLEIPWWCLFGAKTVVAWPLAYHMFNGVRHLVSLKITGCPHRGFIKGRAPGKLTCYEDGFAWLLLSSLQL